MCRFLKGSGGFTIWIESIRVVSINGNNLLITVAGDIVEEKKYPS